MTTYRRRWTSLLSGTSALAALALATTGCALLTPYQEPFAADPVVAGDSDQLAVDRAVLLFDASGSIDYRREFPSEKAWVESFVLGMPEGSYQATIRSFGGNNRRGAPLADFDREQLGVAAEDLKALGGDSPLDQVLLELADELKGVGGHTAVIIVSDGVTNPPRYGGPAEPTLDASRTLVEELQGTVCYHTVLAGDDTDGRALLKAIARTTPCGSFRASSSISNATQLASLERDVFITRREPLPSVAAAPLDPDLDGVIGAADLCPTTPPGASVDTRGCWVLSVQFASNSADVSQDDEAEIAAVTAILLQNPDLKVELGGHTDSSGSSSYNQQLSQRRAAAIKKALVEGGVDASRLEVKGFGEESPVADNATREGRAANRRIELAVLG